MVGEPDISVVESARLQEGFSIAELWLRYFELGGKASPLELEGVLSGLLPPDPLEFDIVVHALNEHFMAQGKNHPIPYARDS